MNSLMNNVDVESYSSLVTLTKPVSLLTFCPQVPESWSWRTDRADCSRNSGNGWPWKVNARMQISWRAIQMSSQRSYLHNVSLFSNLHGLLSDHLKSEKELAEEKQILNEMLEVVEQRDALVALLEEQRLREKEEDKDLEAVMLSKGFNLNWAWCEGNHFKFSTARRRSQSHVGVFDVDISAELWHRHLA